MATNPGAQRRFGNRASRRVSRFAAVGGIITELRGVTWPSREETFRLSVMVIAVAAAVGVFLGVVDLGFSRFFDIILRK